MRSSLASVLPICALGLISICTPARAGTNFVTTAVQASGANWTAAIWKTNSGGGVGVGTALAPSAGNIYETVNNGVLVGNGLSNTRIRCPASPGLQTFPGDCLIMDTNSELRLKSNGGGANGQVGIITSVNFPGVGGNPGFILKGGLIDAGDDGTFPMFGSIQVANPSFISNGANGGGGGISPNRNLIISANLSGTAPLYLLNSGLTLPQAITGTSNTYSGQWYVVCGWLVGSNATALGTNSITVDPQYSGYTNVAPSVASPAGPALLEVGGNMNSAGVLTLTNGGQFRLHQNCTFSSVVIEGTALTPGTHFYPELSASFPGNFPASGGPVGSLTVQPYGAPPNVIPQIINQPVSANLYSGSTLHLAVTQLGDNVTYQWLENSQPISDSGNVSGTATSTLTISGVTAANQGTYALVLSNAGGSVTSSPAALTIVARPTDAASVAFLADSPVAFYTLDDTGDPATNAYAFDFVGGFTGVYGIGVQNGNPAYNIAGPRPSDGFPGFTTSNSAAQITDGANNGINSWITLPALNLNTNTVTIAAWIYQTDVSSNAGIVFCRSGTTVAGLVDNFGVLGYNWNNNASTYNFQSGITLPYNQWSLVGMVISPTNATLYMINSNSFASVVNPIANPSVAFDGPTRIGDDSQDGGNGARGFNGKIDDVAIYNTSLTQLQMLGLYSAASGVSNFSPSIVVEPASAVTVYDEQPFSLTVQASGPSIGYQWQAAPTGSGGPYTNIASGGNFSGAHSATLTVVNVTNVNALDYIVIVTNLSGSVTSTPPSTVTVLQVGPPINVTMSGQQPAGDDWNLDTSTTIGLNTFWSDGNAATNTAFANPGSTWEVLGGARLRSPADTFDTFPGKLTIDGTGVFENGPAAGSLQAEIRFKQSGTAGTNVFPKLVMNGGQLDAGNTALMVIQGEMDILSNTVIYVDSGGAEGRPYRIESYLTGNASIEYHDFDSSFNGSDLCIAGKTNSYTGTWNVVVGALLGTGTNCLGTNNITVASGAALETTYDIHSPNATLTLNGLMYLHQSDTFSNVFINGTVLNAGTYTYAQLAAAFPGNFPGIWLALPGATNTTPSGSITVLNTIPFPVTFAHHLPVQIDLSPRAGVTLSTTPGGSPPFTYQWYLNGAPVSGANGSSFTFNGLPPGNDSIYVVVQNGAGSATNGPAIVAVNATAPVITFDDTQNWTLQGAGVTPTLVADVLTLTDNQLNEAASAFYNIQQYIGGSNAGGFSASFTYTPSGNIAADGVAFVVQNSAAGPTALGGNGGNLGYFGIGNSAAVELNLYTGAGGGVGIGFGTEGAAPLPYVTTAPLNLASGDAINVQLTYSNGVMAVSLTDATAAMQFSTNYVFGDMTTIVGSDVAFVGFTGGTGGSTSIQEISNFAFSYIDAPVQLVPPTITIVLTDSTHLTISWPATTDPSFHLSQSGSLTIPSWSNVSGTPTVVNGQNQLVVPISGGAQFYRLTTQ